MDEIKETQKDSPQVGKAPESSEETTPKVEAKTYTEEDVKKAIQSALTKAGRDAKKLTDWEAGLKSQQQEIDATKAEIVKLQEQIDEAEVESARGDPAKLRELQAKKSYKSLLGDLENKKREMARERAILDRDKVEHEATIEAARETQREIDIWKLAEKYSLDAQMLKDLNLSIEQTEAVAKRLGEKPKTITPDSGVTSGNKTMLKGDAALADFFRKQK